MKKPSIVLQTDFGLTTGFVNSMYGVIKMVDDDLYISDLNHEIRAFDVRQGSFLLADTIPYWRPGTIFVSVVDPGVGTARRGSVAKLKNGSYLVTPDNGTLTALLDQVEAVRQIDESVNRLKGSDQYGTFHGRDVFAYTAARLASGVIDFAGVGPEYPVSEIVTFAISKGNVKPGFAEGAIGSAGKHFGGISFNITIDDFEKTGIVNGDRCKIVIRKDGKVLFEETVLYHKSFGYVKIGEPILCNGSTSPYISMNLNQRRFTDKYLPNIFDAGEDYDDYRVTIQKTERNE